MSVALAFLGGLIVMAVIAYLALVITFTVQGYRLDRAIERARHLNQDLDGILGIGA